MLKLDGEKDYYQDGYTDGFSGFHPQRQDRFENNLQYTEYCVGFCEGVRAASEEDMIRE